MLTARCLSYDMKMSYVAVEACCRGGVGSNVLHHESRQVGGTVSPSASNHPQPVPQEHRTLQHHSGETH